MALELLAGPFTIRNQFTGTPLDSPLTPYGTRAAIWMEGIGLLIPTGDEGLFIAQLDGAAYPVAASIKAVAFGLARKAHGNGGYAMNRPFYTPAGDWSIDPVIWGYGTKESAHAISYSNYVRLDDRYLRPGSNAQLDAAVRGATLGAWLPEASHAGKGTICSFSWANDAREIWIGTRDGWITRYDIEAKAYQGTPLQISTSCHGLWYSARHNIFVSLSEGASSLDVRLWANQPQPAILSAPSTNAALVSGRRITVSATLTGSNGEPCPEEVVAWTLSGPGSLLLAATATDAAGTARTWYDTPGEAAGENVTLTATVVF